MSFLDGALTIPLPSMAGAFEDDGNHGYAGEFTLPLFTMEGAFAETENILTGRFELPQFTMQGALLADANYTGDIRLPGFTMAGTLANGQAFAGDLTLPGFTMSGNLSMLEWTGQLELPSFSMSGRLAAAVLPTFKTWVANTRHGALSEYTNFPFNSFARFNGEYLAAGAGGIYGLSGDDDAGTSVTARVRLALTDLGMAELKRIEEAFLSYRSDGRLVLRLVVDGGLTHEYPLEPTGKTGMYQARVKLGKGLKSNYICLEIENFEGAAFDFDLLRIRPVALSRWVG